MCAKLGHVKLQPCNAKEIFSNCGLYDRKRRNFNAKLALFYIYLLQLLVARVTGSNTKTRLRV